MDKDKFFWREISAEIKNELKNIDRLVIELKEEKDRGSRRAQGSILHDFYNCCERIFRRISLGINGGFAAEETWHKELLYRMTIAIAGLRPAVISEDLAAELDDYLSFRHIFRNIYGFELKSARLERLVDRFEDVSNRFKDEIVKFLDKMEKSRTDN